MADKKQLTEDAISKVITALATSADAENIEIYRSVDAAQACLDIYDDDTDHDAAFDRDCAWLKS